MSAPATILLLGPQRFEPTLARAVRSLGIAGTIAAVTAGWQEREREDDELREHLSGRAHNLHLHERGQAVFDADSELAAAHSERQEHLRRLQVLYRVRLAHVVDAALELMARDEDPELREPAIDDAVAALRDLDAQHLSRLREVHREFDAAWRPLERPSIARHRRQIEEILRKTSALAIAGGHVAILLNRLRLFGVLEVAADRPILAWSAGAMVLSERVITFHDSPPHGAGNAEILDVGLGVIPGIVSLPHASKRLKLDDPVRVSLLARRFAPATCVALDPGARLERSRNRVSAEPGTLRLSELGKLEEIPAA